MLQDLAVGNRQYEERFGFIFIVCATGKTAEEMLALLRQRLANDPEAEIKLAAGEQMKITTDSPGKDRPMSPITTHVLDTALGKPARGIAVVVEIGQGADRWAELARGVTDGDGRIGEFTPHARRLSMPGRLPAPLLHRAPTSRRWAIHGFYPEVDVIVQIDDPAQHYHIPLLLSPFGYTTYRGS